MRVLMVAAECSPYVKVGGLGDVVGALSRTLADFGCDVEVLLPGYTRIDRDRHGFLPAGVLPLAWAGRRTSTALLQCVDEAGVKVTLVDDPQAFHRSGVYDDARTGEGYSDNAARFAFFSRAAVEYVVRDPPDVVHAHDAHPAPAVAFLRTLDRPRLARPVALVLTLHNVAHQLIGPPEPLFDAGMPRDWFQPLSAFEYHGSTNFMKCGIETADAVTTVSERYALEIRTAAFGQGLEGVLERRRDALFGILNGIDVHEWDPAADPHLPAHYDASDLAGKQVCRDALLEDFGLDGAPGAPVFGVVSRLVEQKGIDLLAEVAEPLLRLGARLVVLGSGQAKYERWVQELHERQPRRCGVYRGFHEPLAHRIEAGADFFLMPSRFEPCGLNQMYSMRYGTLPIVRRTGGLADTVIDLEREPSRGTGLVFEDVDARALWRCIQRAFALFSQPEQLAAARRRAMQQDFSWERSAAKYRDLYRRLAGAAPAQGGGG